MVGTAANSDPAVQIVSECLLPECPLFPKAVIKHPGIGLILMSAFGQKRSSTGVRFNLIFKHIQNIGAEISSLYYLD